jgi:BirA family biotin operon repressor/biotin-[acetyl-CoA-carboxylase] ligase
VPGSVGPPLRLGEPRIEVDTCESTQGLLDPTMPEGALAVADVQTAGRGRLGRTWEAPPGTALLCSILLKPPRDRKLPQLALVAGVAVAEALERVSGLTAQIKWPNDVSLGDRKVAGILAEAREGAVVLGMGVNVNQRRDQLPSNAGSLLASTGRSHDRAAVLDELVAALQTRYADWVEGGLAAVYEALSSRDALRGRRVDVGGASGIARRIDPEGRLEVEVGPGRVRTVESGEVTFDG